MPASRSRVTGAVALALTVATALAGCVTDADLDRFDQTWETALNETTCSQWVDDMTANERYAASAELLLESRGDSPGFPTDTQFTYFMSRINAACEDDAERMVAEVAEEVFGASEAQLTQ